MSFVKTEDENLSIIFNDDQQEDEIIDEVIGNEAEGLITGSPTPPFMIMEMLEQEASKIGIAEYRNFVKIFGEGPLAGLLNEPVITKMRMSFGSTKVVRPKLADPKKLILLTPDPKYIDPVNKSTHLPFADLNKLYTDLQTFLAGINEIHNVQFGRDFIRGQLIKDSLSLTSNLVFNGDKKILTEQFVFVIALNELIDNYLLIGKPYYEKIDGDREKFKENSQEFVDECRKMIDTGKSKLGTNIPNVQPIALEEPDFTGYVDIKKDYVSFDLTGGKLIPIGINKELSKDDINKLIKDFKTNKKIIMDLITRFSLGKIVIEYPELVELARNSVIKNISEDVNAKKTESTIKDISILNNLNLIIKTNNEIYDKIKNVIDADKDGFKQITITMKNNLKGISKQYVNIKLDDSETFTLKLPDFLFGDNKKLSYNYGLMREGTNVDQLYTLLFNYITEYQNFFKKLTGNDLIKPSTLGKYNPDDPDIALPIKLEKNKVTPKIKNGLDFYYQLVQIHNQFIYLLIPLIKKDHLNGNEEFTIRPTPFKVDRRLIPRINVTYIPGDGSVVMHDGHTFSSTEKVMENNPSSNIFELITPKGKKVAKITKMADDELVSHIRKVQFERMLQKILSKYYNLTTTPPTLKTDAPWVLKGYKPVTGKSFLNTYVKEDGSYVDLNRELFNRLINLYYKIQAPSHSLGHDPTHVMAGGDSMKP